MFCYLLINIDSSIGGLIRERERDLIKGKETFSWHLIFMTAAVNLRKHLVHFVNAVSCPYTVNIDQEIYIHQRKYMFVFMISYCNNTPYIFPQSPARG